MGNQEYCLWLKMLEQYPVTHRSVGFQGGVLCVASKHHLPGLKRVSQYQPMEKSR